jgi:hypothetical protein
LKKTEELVVIAKTYDLILGSRNHASRRPRCDGCVGAARLHRAMPPTMKLATSALARRVVAQAGNQ